MAAEPGFSIPASSTNVAPNHQTIDIIDLSSDVQNEELYLANSKFESYDELLKSVRDFYYTKGYGVSIRDSRKDKYVTLQCDRGGSYRDRLGIGCKRKRSTGSRLIECPFRILGKKENDGAWVLKAKNLTHTHEPSTDISGHSSFRRLSSDDIQSVKNMTLSGIPPRQILSSLRQRNQDLPAVSRNIYNLKTKIRKENLRNRSMVSALFEEFEKEGFIYDILHNPKGHITHLFFAHPLSITLSLDLIHPHWRIDTLSLNIEDDSHNDSANKFDELLSELSSRYQMWPLSKKDFATSMINKLLDESETFFEPMVRRPKGRPPKSKKKRGMSSTTRDPSRFEHVESSQIHNPSSATQVSLTNNEVVENNLLDLNAYPVFSSDDMLFE